MWCYQKPGFEAFLLAELQRQQQCIQFCDTMLMAEGVSVPAHSCILSAISPQLSTALSSKTLPPAGQRHHLEFGTMSACTLLHMVRLLYSGEMAGEGEEEKQKAISAAAKMGIHGLVEVTQQDRTRRAEVGVQTEPLTSEEDEVRHVKWRRGVQDGSTVLWKETQPAGAINFPTLTEELQVNAAPAEAPYETIDMASLQSLQQTNSHLLTHQFPYVPISVICSQDENHLPQTCSDPAACFQESPPEGHIPVPTPSYPSVPFSLPHAGPTTQLSADCHAWLSTRQAAGKHLAPGKEFSDKQIETFQDNIPGFINYFLNPHEETFRGGRARRKRRARRARMSRASERRARAPRVRGGGRWQGRLTQTVAVQEVGVSKMQKLHVQRLGRHTCRTGQGGGAVGRKSCLKTRQHLKPTGRRGRCGKGLDFSPSGELHHGGTQGGNTWSRRTTSQHANHTCHPVSQETPASFSSPPGSFHSVSGPGPSLPSCPSAAHCPPALQLLHNTAFPPPAPLPHVDQPENFDRFLEEVMMGLDILPNRVPSASCGSTHVSAAERGAGVCRPVNTERSVEPELTAMLDLLQSVEQRDDGAVDVEAVPSRSTSVPRHKYKARTTVCRSRREVRRRLSTVQQSDKEERTPPPPGVKKQKQTQRNTNTNRVLRAGHRQLCLMPVVKLERYPPPHSDTSKTVKKRELRPAGQEKQAVTNNYLTRSRLKEAKDALRFLEQPLPQTHPQQPHHRLKTNMEPLAPNEGSWPTPAQPPEQPEDLLVPARSKGKRRAEAGGQMGDGASAGRRRCVEGPFTLTSPHTAAESEEYIDVETLSLCASEDMQRDEKNNVVWIETVVESESKQEQLSDSEFVDVEGDSDCNPDGVETSTETLSEPRGGGQVSSLNQRP